MALIVTVSMVWGPSFIDTFARFGLPSLLQPGNVPALKAAGHEVEHMVYTIRDDCIALEKIGADLGAPLTIRTTAYVNAGTTRQVQNSMLVDAAKQIIERNGYFVLSNAGHVWGNGTLVNAVNVAEKTGCGVGVIYLNVDADKFAEAVADFTPYRHDELALCALGNLHPGARSTLNATDSRCHMTGTGMMQLAPNLIAARIQVPSVFVVKLRPQDLALFRLECDFTCWDTSFPAHLIREGRYTFMASSDLGFIASMVRPKKINMDAFDKLADLLGPMADRRMTHRATLQSEAARTFMATIRTSGDIVL